MQPAGSAAPDAWSVPVAVPPDLSHDHRPLNLSEA